MSLLLRSVLLAVGPFSLPAPSGIVAYFGAPGAHDATASTAEVMLMRLTLSLMNRPRITTVWSFIAGRLNSLSRSAGTCSCPPAASSGCPSAWRLVGDARHRIGGGHQHPVRALLAQAPGDADDVDLLRRRLRHARAAARTGPQKAQIARHDGHYDSAYHSRRCSRCSLIGERCSCVLLRQARSPPTRPSAPGSRCTLCGRRIASRSTSRTIRCGCCCGSRRLPAAAVPPNVSAAERDARLAQLTSRLRRSDRLVRRRSRSARRARSSTSRLSALRDRGSGICERAG